MSSYIKKISLESVESFLGVSLKNNIISIGFDVSMHSTGVAMIKTTNKYLILDTVSVIKVPKNITNVLTAIDLFLDQLDDFKRTVSNKYHLDISIVEDCFFGRNVKTLKRLARFGVLIYDRFRGISKENKLMLPNVARSRINFKKSSKKSKGKKLKKEIMEYINNALDVNIKDTDKADGVVLALAGLLEE